MKIVSIIKYLITVVGLGMLFGAFSLYTNTQDFISGAVAANGKVIELVRSSDSTTYKPVVQFKTKNGKIVQFTSSSGSNPPSYSQGDVVEVLYEESSPNQAKIKGLFSLWGWAIILGVLGTVFSLIGLSIIAFGYLKNKKINYLKRNGTPIIANFQSVEVNGSLEVNGRNPYQICVQWKNPATSELHIFNSENIWFDPTDHINQEEIIVLIEKDNPGKYYVDISFLPKFAS